VCGKHELDWAIKGWRIKVPNILKLLLGPPERKPILAPVKNRRI